jgi:S-adenosylhomocysteine hydrolase
MIYLDEQQRASCEAMRIVEENHEIDSLIMSLPPLLDEEVIEVDLKDCIVVEDDLAEEVPERVDYWR